LPTLEQATPPIPCPLEKRYLFAGASSFDLDFLMEEANANGFDPAPIPHSGWGHTWAVARNGNVIAGYSEAGFIDVWAAPG
jgi:hypothetical protein